MKLIKQVSDKYEIDRDEVYGRHHTAHLIHTGHILKKAGCDSEVVNAGILHSIYDADSMYGNEGVPISERSTIALMTNPQTEKLIYKYSIAHVADNYENILVSEHAEDPYSARALADILICDMIEQIIWCVEKKIFLLTLKLWSILTSCSLLQRMQVIACGKFLIFTSVSAYDD